jgi:hypothetical protein
MLRVISGQDIDMMIHESLSKRLPEGLEIFVGKDEDQKPIISPGLKLQEEDSGLVYTVICLKRAREEFYLECERGDGARVKIYNDDLKNYRRL